MRRRRGSPALARQLGGSGGIDPLRPFLEGARCTVYEARPSQCGTFPFWPENLKSRADWDELGTFCPGIGQGDLIPLHAIREQLRGRASS